MMRLQLIRRNMLRASIHSTLILMLSARKVLVEKVKEKMYVVQNPPAMPLTQMEMDDVYSLPYMRDYHPVYKKMGGIPALSEIKILSYKQQRMLRRMFILCAYLPSGTYHTDKKP